MTEQPGRKDAVGCLLSLLFWFSAFRGGGGASSGTVRSIVSSLLWGHSGGQPGSTFMYTCPNKGLENRPL